LRLSGPGEALAARGRGGEAYWTADPPRTDWV
jgi:hypothetical protein